MPAPKLIRCGKCHVVMGVRYFVLVHRRPGGVQCPPVICTVCGNSVGHERYVTAGEPVCSSLCARNHPSRTEFSKADREVAEQLDAIERAEFLPAIYQRPRHAS